MCCPHSSERSVAPPLVDLASEIPDSLVCGYCAQDIDPVDDPMFLLECGCVQHLYCLLDEADDLEYCATCDTPITPTDMQLLANEMEYDLQN